MTARGGVYCFFLCCFFVLLGFLECSVDSSQIRVLTDIDAPPASYPKIAPSFLDPNVTTGDVLFGGANVVWYDSQQELFRLDSNATLLGQSFNETTIQTADVDYTIKNGVCRVEEGSFQDFFSWLPLSTYNGEVFVEGRGPCDEWIYHTDEGVLVLDAIGNTPVRLIYPQKMVTSDTPSNTTFIFSTSWTPVNFTADNSSIFSPPAGCGEMKVCSSGPAVNETFYLFHDANDYTLINTNIADQTGDVSFVCFSVLFDVFSYFSWVSEYTIEVNTTFGQYAMCNFGTCIGGADDRVGHEAAAGFSVDGGQCTANNVTGNWFSFPSYNESLCPGGGLGDSTYNETVGINGTSWSGCGWKVIEKIKTIDGKCLENHGFRNACLADLAFPWPTAARVWQAAFLYDDESQGGCPPIVNTTLSNEEPYGAAPFYPKSLSLPQPLSYSRVDKKIMPYTRWN